MATSTFSDSSLERKNRAERLRQLSVKQKQTQTSLPYFETFLERLQGDDSMFVSSADLHKEYISHVMKHTNNANALELAGSANRFAKHMKRESGRRRWEYIAGPNRGYRIRLQQKRLERRGLYHGMRVKTPPKVVYVDPTRGYGLFATADYKEGDLVCDYFGEIIDIHEKTLREEEYEKRNISYRIINLPNGKFLDGARDRNGQELPVTENPGAAMNNSKSSANCRLCIVDGNYVMVATTGIHNGAECVWWYGDSRRIAGCEWLQE